MARLDEARAACGPASFNRQAGHIFDRGRTRCRGVECDKQGGDETKNHIDDECGSSWLGKAEYVERKNAASLYAPTCPWRSSQMASKQVVNSLVGW